MPDRQSGRRADVRLLVTSAGRRVALIECFRASAAELGLTLDVLACDFAPEWSSAARAADRAFGVPPVTHDDYIPALMEICQREQVTMLVPTIDPELAPISVARDAFAAIGVEAVVSDPAVVRIAGDKLATAELLRAHGVDAPTTSTPEEVLRDPGAWHWPSLAKPRGGSSGRGVRIVADTAELQEVAEQEPYVVQDLLRGDEFTVNFFVDRQGVLRCAIPHRRVQVRAGEVEKGVTLHHPALEDAARRIAACLPGARGPLCFQAMVTDDRCAVFEINARFGGGYPLAHRAGATFTRWLLQQHLGREDDASNRWAEDVMMLRYDAAFFVGP